MADKTLVLYISSSSTYNLEGIPHAINPVPENTFMGEEAKAVIMAPLAIMPPPFSGASGGMSVRSTARMKVPQGGTQPRRAPPSKSSSGIDSLKRKALGSATKSVHVTPSGNTIFSHSYTTVGIQKPNGGCGKGLICKLGKGKGLVENPDQKSVSKETAGSSSKSLRIKRVNKPPVLKSCAIFEEDKEPLPPQDPAITSLNNKITTLREQVRFLRG